MPRSILKKYDVDLEHLGKAKIMAMHIRTAKIVMDYKRAREE